MFLTLGVFCVLKIFENESRIAFNDGFKKGMIEMNNKREKKSYLEAIGIIIWVGTILSMFLVAHWAGTVASHLMLSLIYLYLVNRSSDIEKENITAVRMLIAIISSVLSLVWLFTRNYGLFIVIILIGCYIGIFEIIAYLTKKGQSWKKGGDILDRIIFVVWIFILITFSALSIFLARITLSPHNFAYQFRNNVENATEAPESKTVKLESGYYLTNDVQYSDRYANYFFDVYSDSDDFSVAKPVFIYIHGGYYVYGDKQYGDPNSKEKTGYYEMINSLIDKGFTVVTPNYALTPEFSYPAPIHQMEDLAVFLKEHGAEYGIDANQIVYGGGGTGGQIAAQFVLTQTDKTYADELHIDQVLTNGEIKAVYLGTALLNPAKVTDSDVFFVDFMLYQMARSYFDAGSMEKSPRAQQANIIEHVTENFPATYITDGNYMSFASQARDFVRKLEKLGVEYEYLNFNSDEYMGETIMQGYDVQNNEFADLNRGKMVEFLSKQVIFVER